MLMHPLCCVSTVGERNSSPFAEIIDMSAMKDESNLNKNNNNNGCRSSNHEHSSSGGSGGDHGRLMHRTAQSSADDSSSSNQLMLGDHREVKINDIVGNGISGVLHKWVNYGKGWRPRWFVLQDGVLSYFKIHGPDKILVSEVTVKGSKVIGDESFRRISRHRKNCHFQLRRRPVGEVHLKVSSIRESRSDDKRFSIFTGTKRLHLRAETRDDRAAWMEALQRVKDMFPRISNSELMAPVDSFVISTDKLRMRLLDEGVSERAIQDVEQIVRAEFSAFQNQLVLLKQKQLLLIDTLRQLEVHIMMRRKHLASRIQNSSSVSSHLNLLCNSS